MPAGSVGGFSLDTTDYPLWLLESEAESSASNVRKKEEPGGRAPGSIFCSVATPDDWLQRINSLPSGWVKEMGIVLTEAGPERVSCEFEVGPQHHQGYGIVHGGVHSGVIETIASVGAAIIAHPRGQAVVGLENSTSFIRAVRAGRLHATATPVTAGRTSQVWEARIWDEGDRLVATGRVRLLCLDPDQAVAGSALIQRPEA